MRGGAKVGARGMGSENSHGFGTLPWAPAFGPGIMEWVKGVRRLSSFYWLADDCPQALWGAASWVAEIDFVMEAYR